jgi:hypothetical protein
MPNEQTVAIANDSTTLSDHQQNDSKTTDNVGSPSTASPSSVSASSSTVSSPLNSSSNDASADKAQLAGATDHQKPGHKESSKSPVVNTSYNKASQSIKKSNAYNNNHVSFALFF